MRTRCPSRERWSGGARPKPRRALLGALGCWAGWLCALAAAPPCAEAAVDDYLGRPIAAVHLVVEGRETNDPAIARFIETAAGQPLTMAAVRETIAHLFSLGRFDDVRVDAALETGRVVLRYELSPVHPVTSIQFAGGTAAAGVDPSDLRKAIVDRYGASPSLGRVEDMKQIVGEILRERGYRHPVIEAQAEIAHRPDRAALVFTIEPGARTVIGDVDVVGAPEGSQAELVARLGLARGRPYQPEALNARIERYVADRRKAGYYEARVIATPRFADGDRIANLTLTVSIGPHVRVVFRGDPLPADRRAELVPVEREGSVDEDLLEDSTNRIEEYFRGQGFRDARAPHTRMERDGELLVTFDVARGPEYRVAAVDIGGNRAVSAAELQPGLRLRAGAPFVESTLDADVAAIEDAYRRRGFTEAKVRPYVEPAAAGPSGAVAGADRTLVVPLRVEIDITEGPRTVVSDIQIEGAAAVPEEELRAGLGLKPGGPYVETQLVLDREAIQQQYASRGYLAAVVDAAPRFSADRTRAAPLFTIREGPRTLIDHVLIVGNVRTSTAVIERALPFKAGDPLSEPAKIEGRRRLAALGLFRRIQISELSHGDPARRDLLVVVEESPSTTVVYGAGLEGRVRVIRTGLEETSDRLDVAPRGTFEISRRNLFGKNRSVSLFTSMALHLRPTQQVFDERGQLTANGPFSVPEYRVLGTYREPGLFGSPATNGTVTGTFEQQVRTSFSYARRGASAEITRKLTPVVGLSASYQIQRTRVFDESVNPDEQRLIDRLFPGVRLSSVSVAAIRDTRDDAVDPATGDYLSANLQVAARRIGSEVGFAKTFMRAQIFRTVPQHQRLVLAGNASLGMAAPFPREVVGLGGQAATIEDLPASERFFAGGDSTVRGFSQDTLGTPATLDKDGLPIGGNATVILNAELRAAVWPSIQAVGFIDAGNVFARTSELALGELRTAAGVGVRYRSPVGPIRIDVGFKLRPEIVAGRREGLTALHISLGQAF